MDLRVYYLKVRDAQSKLTEPYPLVVSQETEDGGKAGTITEVPAALAAKMLVDGTVRLATESEAQAHREAQTAIRLETRQGPLAQPLQVTATPADAKPARPAKTEKEQV